MSDEKRRREPSEHPHDDREIDARAITSFSVVVMVLCLLSFGAALWLVNALGERAEGQHDPPLHAATARPVAPEGPLLQARPETGLSILRAEEELRLGQYAVIEGRVRIPIDRAMDLVAERGLPTRDDPPVAPAPVSRPNESGLGLAPEGRTK